MEDIAWIEQILKDIKDDLKFVRNNSIPHIHTRIDELSKKVACLEGKIKGTFNNYKGLYAIIFLLLLMIGAILGIKTLPKLPFNF